MSVKISVPNPCHEKWQEMSKSEKGRFCSSCEKTVYDMTKLTDKELVELVSSESNICGRFKNAQLNRELSVLAPLKPGRSGWSIAASLLVGLTFLASCNEVVTTGEPDYVVGKMEAPKEHFQDSLKNQLPQDSLVNNIDSTELDMKVGKLQVKTPPQKNCDVKIVPVPVDTMDFIMGDVIYIEDSTSNQSD